MTTTVLLLGTLDTKGEECGFVRARLREHGCEVLTVDVGVLGRPAWAADRAVFDVLRAELARDVELVELDCHINDPAFAAAVADRFAAVSDLSHKESVTR